MDARHIYQNALDIMSAGTVAGDVDAVARHTHLPFHLKTLEGSVAYNTVEELKQGIHDYRRMMQDMGCDALVRDCDTAKRVGATRIVGYHTTKLQSAGQNVLPPFLSKMVMILDGDMWKASSVDTSVRTADLTGTETPFVQQFLDPRNRRVSKEEALLRLFQTILDRVSAVLINGDADGWVSAVALPFQLVTRQGIQSFDTEAALREDFAVYQKEFKDHGVTDIFRQALTAQLIDGDQMTGTYRTHIMRGGNHVVPPWESSMTLRNDNGQWRITTVMRAIGHLNWSAITPADIENTDEHYPEKGDKS